jgi:streptogramin lyase
VITAGNDVAHGSIDSSGDLWLTTESSYQIARVTSTGASVFTPIVTVQQPEIPAIDASGNAWIAIQSDNPSAIYKVAPNGTFTVLGTGTTNSTFHGHTAIGTGATLTATFGSAVDGNGNVWFANRAGSYGTPSGRTGTNTIFEINGSNNLAISPTSNYILEAQYPATPTSFTNMLDDSLNVAIDPSGNVWVTNYLGNSVVEVVGAAAPVVTPLSVAAGTNKLGQTP